MNLKIILLLLVILFSFLKLKIEGFINNNTTYRVCRNRYNKMDNNYLVRENDVSPLPVGFYSALLNVGEARDSRRYLEPPICLREYSFNNDYFLNHKITDCPDLPGNCDSVNNITPETYKNNTEPLEDPMFLLGKVRDNNSKILYNEEIISDILSAHDVNVEEIVKRVYEHH